MTPAQMIHSLQIKVANIAGEANSGRSISPAVLALGLAEIQEALANLAAKMVDAK